MHNSRLLYINVANVVVKINFKKENGLYEVGELFIDRIKRLLKEFTIIKTKNVDFYLDVIYKNSFDIMINTKSKNHWINFYQEVSPKRYITYYHISDEQFIIVIRDIIQLLIAKKNGVIMHGATSALNNKGIVFLGKSGAGKSTIVNLLQPEFTPLSDDIFILKKEKDVINVYQTPYLQKNKYKKEKFGKFPLKCIFFIKQGNDEKKDLIKQPEKIFKLLAKQLFTDTTNKNNQLKFLLNLSFTFPNVYVLNFTLKNKAKLLQTIYED